MKLCDIVLIMGMVTLLCASLKSWNLAMMMQGAAFVALAIIILITTHKED